ncbi:MAG: NeuD/PglB/VioB family sugar acetyltransferase [Bdellovibrionales bacterium]|nr:NeuD/PglB/VioB family sugar acetyltransferase [Bdellovibrionales bacterium]
MKKKVAILGSRELANYISKFIIEDDSYELIGFIDDYETKNSINGIPIIGKIVEVEKLTSEQVIDGVLMGIGYKNMSARKEIFEKLANKTNFFNYIHPYAWVAKNVKLGVGCFVSPGCIIDQSSVIGNNNFLFSGCVFAHDTQVADHCFFGPHVTMAGNCIIEKLCFLGVGSVLKNNIRIVENSTVGAGAVVINNIEQSGTYVGNPARLLASPRFN